MSQRELTRLEVIQRVKRKTLKQKVRDKAGDDKAQRQAEAAQRKTQAIDILKGIEESASDIQDTQKRVAVLTGALDLLWKYDEAYARTNFIKSAGALSDRFASDTTSRDERSDIRASMGMLLMAFARHDSRAAGVQLSKFQKILEDVLKGNSISPMQAAKRDWAGALLAAQSIESKVLRSQAYIAACATVL